MESVLTDSDNDARLEGLKITRAIPDRGISEGLDASVTNLGSERVGQHSLYVGLNKQVVLSDEAYLCSHQVEGSLDKELENVRQRLIRNIRWIISLQTPTVTRTRSHACQLTRNARKVSSA